MGEQQLVIDAFRRVAKQWGDGGDHRAERMVENLIPGVIRDLGASTQDTTMTETNPLAELQSFRKKPVVIQAVKYVFGMEDGFVVDGRYYDKIGVVPRAMGRKPAIKTMEGHHEITEGDWIITGVKGERYPCKPDVFAMTYEPAALSSQAAGGEVEFQAISNALLNYRCTHQRDDDGDGFPLADALTPETSRTIQQGEEEIALIADAVFAALYTTPPAPASQSDGMDALEDAARKLYAKSTDNHPTIHCNRFPTWRELTQQERDEWRGKAASRHAGGGGSDER